MELLKQLRLANNLTQARLAKLANTTPGQIKHLEKGVRTFTKEWAKRLAPHLNVTAQDLMFPKDDKLLNTQVDCKDIPVLLQLSNKEWLEKNENIFKEIQISPETENFCLFPANRQLFASKILTNLQDNLAKQNDLAICMLLTTADISKLKDHDIILLRTNLEQVNLVKYSLYKIQSALGSETLTLSNCFENATGDKITFNINTSNNTKIIAKVCYFVRPLSIHQLSP